MLIANPERDREVLLRAAEEICIAARTAPKANGEDIIVTGIVYGSELECLQVEMERIGREKALEFMVRDAKNIEGTVVVLIGAIPKSYPSVFCEPHDERIGKCIESAVDLGIAIGSAASTAMELKIDNRIMLSIGWAAVNLKLLGENVKIAYGIPLSISGKNPFFDRRKK
jgi:uncharacterized ferredoxin-like protein